MGQRLNIEIIKNGEVLANAYYHWSAYTSSALHLTKLIIDNVDEVQHEDDVIRAVRLLEKTGALLTSDEIQKMKQRNDKESFEKAVDRNAGLIAISKEGIKDTRKWEEGRVEIDLDKETVNFNVFWICDKETYLDDYEKSEEEYQQLTIETFDFNNIPFAKFNEFAFGILQNIHNDIYAFRLENGDVLSFIE